MKRYGQYCALAKALEVVGDRWTLLIVRELMARGAARYTDLQRGLPGIASNLLADRLRDLQSQGVVTSREEPAPVAATLYRLTERGEALRPIVRELGRWGMPLLAKAGKGDIVRGYWAGLPMELYLSDGQPAQPPVTLEVRIDDEPVTVSIGGGEVRSSIGAAQRPDAVISGPVRAVMNVLFARENVDAARKSGVSYKGDRTVLARLKPASA